MRTQPGNYIRLTSTTSFSLWTQNRTWILELTWDERGMSHTFISHKLYLNDINITSTGIHLDFAPFLIIHRASWSSNESKVSLTFDCEEKFLKEESSNSIFCRKSLIISQNTSHPFLFKLAGTHINPSSASGRPNWTFNIPPLMDTELGDSKSTRQVPVFLGEWCGDGQEHKFYHKLLHWKSKSCGNPCGIERRITLWKSKSSTPIKSWSFQIQKNVFWTQLLVSMMKSKASNSDQVVLS